MKPIRVLLSLIVVVAVLFASTVFAQAIGFEAEQAYESVFVIYSGSALGSGFAVGENCIVTNAHVIDNPKSITVETYGGSKYRATVLGMDQQLDIAVLVVPDAQFPYLEIADLDAMKTGDDIYAIGAPNGMAYTLTKGGISAKERAIGGQTYIQIDAPINQGNSGGPLLNDAGQVLGMNTLKMSDAEGIGLAIPITRVCRYLQSLGVPLSDSGNVSQTVTLPTEPTVGDESPVPPNDDPYVRDDAATAPLNSLLVIGLVLSLLGNGILILLLILERKKRPSASPVPYDPTERTDFDIDILD